MAWFHCEACGHVQAAAESKIGRGTICLQCHSEGIVNAIPTPATTSHDRALGALVASRDFLVMAIATTCLAILAAGVFASVFINFGSGPTDDTPYFIDDRNVYYAPPLVANDQRSFAIAMITSDAIDEGFRPLDQKVSLSTGKAVYVDPRTMTWVLKDDPRGHTLLSVVSRKELLSIPGRRPDLSHRDAGGFQEWCGPTKWLLQKLGICKPKFNHDGSWNW